MADWAKLCQWMGGWQVHRSVIVWMYGWEGRRPVREKLITQA